MGRGRAIAFLALVAALGVWSAEGARAGSTREMIVCYPGKPGSTHAGQNTMDALTEYLAGKAGFEAGGLHATYYNDERPAVAAVKVKKPQFAILSLGVYLKWRKSGEKLEIVAQSNRWGKSTEQYHVLVPKGSARRDLAALKGGVLASNHLDDAVFATNVVFARALDVAKDVALVSSRSVLGFVRHCARKKPMSDGRLIDAIVLDDDQLQGMSKLPELGQLEEIWSSRPLPTPPVVTFAENADKGEARKLTDALLGMAKDPEGKAILDKIEATGFDPAAPEAYAQVERDY